MKFITLQEFNTMKVYALDNLTYSRIERKFMDMMYSEELGRELMLDCLQLTIRELSANTWVNILDCLTIVG